MQRTLEARAARISFFRTAGRLSSRNRFHLHHSPWRCNLAPHPERDLIDIVTDRFFFLASFPYLGRSREEDFGPGYRTLAVGEYVIVYCVENEDALVLRIVHGRRDLEALFGHS